MLKSTTATKFDFVFQCKMSNVFLSSSSSDNIAFSLNVFLQIVDRVVDDVLLVVRPVGVGVPEHLLDLVQRSALGLRHEDQAEDEDQDHDGSEAPEHGGRPDGLAQWPEPLSDAEAQSPIERS